MTTAIGTCLPCGADRHEACSALHGSLMGCACATCGPNESVAMAALEQLRHPPTVTDLADILGAKVA